MRCHAIRGGAKASHRFFVYFRGRHGFLGFRPVVTFCGGVVPPTKEMVMFGSRVFAGIKCMLVPAGEFVMGSPEGVGSSDERPQHRVELGEFWMAETPITNEDYRRFCVETGRTLPTNMDKEDFNHQRHPVVCVDWNDSKAFCAWMTQKIQEETGSDEWEVRLPTEQEWEYAARGPQGFIYPWGDDEPTSELACYYSEGRNGPDVVGSHPKGKSWCGILDLAGNVWEWCEDIYKTNAYAELVRARELEGKL